MLYGPWSSITFTLVSEQPVVPSAENDSFLLEENSSTIIISVLDNDLDPYGTGLTISGVASSQGGVVSVNSGSPEIINYQPPADFSGTDTITYTITDGGGVTDTGTVTVTIHDYDDTLIVARNTNLILNSTTTFSGFIGDGPEGNTDVDMFQINMNLGEMIIIDLDASILDDGTEFSELDGFLRLFDASGNEILFNDNASDPDTGVSSTDPFLSYTVAVTGTYFIGISAATNSDYDATSAGSGSAATGGEYYLQLTMGENYRPLAVDDVFITSEDVAVVSGNVLDNNPDTTDSDPDGQTLTVVAIEGGAIGVPLALSSGVQVTLNTDGSFSYDPSGVLYGLAAGELITDSFTYTVSDSQGATDSATVLIKVNGENDVPIAEPDTIWTDEDTTVNGSLFGDNGSGMDRDPDASDSILVIEVNGATEIVGIPMMLTSGAMLTVNSDGTYSYDPNGQFESLVYGETVSDSFSYMIADSEGSTSVTTVTFNIQGRSEYGSEGAVLNISDSSRIEHYEYESYRTTGVLEFIITLSQPVEDEVTFLVNTVAGTADGSDYTEINNQLVSFSPGQISTIITVDILNDFIYEGTETFSVILSAPKVNGVTNLARVGLDDITGMGTIYDDEIATISINNIVVSEDVGTATFTVTLDEPVNGYVFVNYETVGFLAQSSDFNAVNGTLIFDGMSGSEQTISIQINDDTNLEGNEFFYVQLSELESFGLPVVLGNSRGTAIIEDNEDVSVPSIPGFTSLTYDKDTGILIGAVDQSLGLYSNEVEIDYDFDGDVDLSTTASESDGFFMVTLDRSKIDLNLSASPFPRSFDVRMSGFNVETISRQYQPWYRMVFADYELTPLPGSIPSFNYLSVDGSSAVVTGAINDALDLAEMSVDVDYDYDGVVDMSVSGITAVDEFIATLDLDNLDSSGFVNFRLSGIQGSNPDRVAQQWYSLDASTVLITTDLEITSLQLLNDTDIIGDNITTDLTIVGQALSANGYDNIIIEFDTNGDGIVEQAVTVDSAGNFIIEPASYLDINFEYTVNVRARDLAENKISEWEEISFTWQRHDSPLDWITVTDNGLIEYSIAVDQSLYWDASDVIGFEIDYDLDSIADSIFLDETPGNQYDPWDRRANIEEIRDDNLLRIRLIRVGGSSNLPEFKTVWYDTLFAPVPKVLSSSLQLYNDTGWNTHDGVTINPTIIGEISYESDMSDDQVIVNIDLNGDGIVDATTEPELDGHLVFDPSSILEYGRHEIKVQATSKYTGAESDWETIIVTYIPPADFPQVTYLHLVVDSENPSDHITSDARLRWRLEYLGGNIFEDQVVTHVDINIDGQADLVLAPTTSNIITYDLASLFSYDQISIQLKAVSELTGEEGEWVSFDLTYIAPLPPDSIPKIDWVYLENDDVLPGDKKTTDPVISGLSENVSYIRVDPDISGIPDQIISTDSSGAFSFDPTPFIEYGDYEFSFLPIADTGEEGSLITFSFSYYPANFDDSFPVIQNLQLENDTELPGDLSSRDVTIVGNVNYDQSLIDLGKIKQLRILVDWSGDQHADTVLIPDENGNFTFDAAGFLDYGENTVGFAAGYYFLNDLGNYEYTANGYLEIDFEYVPEPPVVEYFRLKEGSQSIVEGKVDYDGDISTLEVRINDFIGVTLLPINSDGTFSFDLQAVNPAGYSGIVYASIHKISGTLLTASEELNVDYYPEDPVFAIKNISMLNDTGVVGDNISRDLTIKGWAAVAGLGIITSLSEAIFTVEYDVNSDGTIDGSATPSGINSYFEIYPSTAPIPFGEPGWSVYQYQPEYGYAAFTVSVRQRLEVLPEFNSEGWEPIYSEWVEITIQRELPEFTSRPKKYVIEGNTVSFTPTPYPSFIPGFTPGENAPWIQIVDPLPGMSIDPSTNEFTWDTSPFQSGSHTVKFSYAVGGMFVNGDTVSAGIYSTTLDYHIVVQERNHNPFFDGGDNIVFVQGTDEVEVTGWATGIEPGLDTDDESAQKLEFSVSNNNPDLFIEPPTINADGTLRFVAVPDAVGTATIDVILQDDGLPHFSMAGTHYGDDSPFYAPGYGPSNSEIYQFTITVFVPAKIEIDPIMPKSVIEDEVISFTPGYQHDWHDDLSLIGISNETVGYSISETPESIIIDSVTGEISWAPTHSVPAGDYEFTVTYHVEAPKLDGSGTRVLETTETFTITVIERNHAPEFTVDSSDEQIIVLTGNTPAEYRQENWAQGIIPGIDFLDEQNQTLTFMVNAVSGADLFDVPPQISSDGTLTFTPSADFTGTAEFSIVLSDDGGTANGGIDQSSPLLLKIRLIPSTVNSNPVFQNTPQDYVYVGETFEFTPIVLDIDGNSLKYELVEDDSYGTTLSPANPDSGYVSWTATADMVDKTFHYTLQVEDDNEGMATLPFSVKVMEDPLNHAPIITSEITDAIRTYRVGSLYDPDNLDSETNLHTNRTLYLNLEQDEKDIRTLTFDTDKLFLEVDLSFIVDESYSMETEHEWLYQEINNSLENGMVQLLDDKLIELGIDSIKYNLIGYGFEFSGNDLNTQTELKDLDTVLPLIRNHVVGGTLEDFLNSAENELVVQGYTEPGHAAIQYALTEIPKGTFRIDPGFSTSELKFRLTGIDLSTSTEVTEDWITIDLTGSTPLPVITPGFSNIILDDPKGFLLNKGGVLQGTIDDSLGLYNPRVEVDYSLDGSVDEMIDVISTPYFRDGSAKALILITDEAATPEYQTSFHDYFTSNSPFEITPVDPAHSTVPVDPDDPENLDERPKTTYENLYDRLLSESAILDVIIGADFVDQSTDHENWIELNYADLKTNSISIPGISSYHFDESNNVLTGTIDNNLDYETPVIELTPTLSLPTVNNQITPPYVLGLDLNDLPRDFVIADKSTLVNGNDGTFSISLDSSLINSEGKIYLLLRDIETALGVTGNDNPLNPNGVDSIHVDQNGNVFYSSDYGLEFVNDPDDIDANSDNLISLLSVNDYATLAWATGGSAWNLNLLDKGDTDLINAFTDTFVELKAESLIQQFTVDINGPSTWFKKLNDTPKSLTSGGTIQFDAEFTGENGYASFSVDLRNEDTGAIMGTIPVVINGNSFYDAHAIDPDGDTVSYDIDVKKYDDVLGEWIVSEDDFGAVIGKYNGIINWQPEEVGDYEFTLIAADDRGGTHTQTWTTAVELAGANNNVPEIEQLDDITVTPSQSIQLQISATDADDDSIAYYLADENNDGTPIPNGMKLNYLTGELTWTPSLAAEEPYTISVIATDGIGQSELMQFNITVDWGYEINHLPQITESPDSGSVLVNELYRSKVSASDLDNNEISYAKLTGPDGLAIDSKTGEIVWSPTAEDLGSHPVLISVKDSEGGVVLHSITLDVVTGNHAPTFIIPALEMATPGEEWTLDLTTVIQDEDDDAISFSLYNPNQISNLYIDSQDILHFTPRQAGAVVFGLYADDGEGGTALTPLKIYANTTPEIVSIPMLQIQQGQDFSYNIAFKDADPNQVLTYTLISFTDEVTGNPVSVGTEFVLSNNPDSIHWTTPPIGEYRFKLRVTDQFTVNGVDLSRESEQEFLLSVIAAQDNGDPNNNIPYFTSDPNSAGPVFKEQQWSYQLLATDVDVADTINITLLTNPDGMILDESIPGEYWIRWTPNSNYQAGDEERVEIRVTDSHGAWNAQIFNLPVNIKTGTGTGSNTGPAITSNPIQEAELGQLYEYQITVEPGVEATFHDRSIYDSEPQIPAWLTINETTGLVSGVPTEPGTYAITVYTRDASGNEASKYFSLHVAPINSNPDITSIPFSPLFINTPVDVPSWTHKFTYSDPDGDYVVLGLPTQDDQGNPINQDFTLDADTVTFIGTTLGMTELTVTVRDYSRRELYLQNPEDNWKSEQTVTFTFDVLDGATQSSDALQITSTPEGPAQVGKEWVYQIEVPEKTGFHYSSSKDLTPESNPDLLQVSDDGTVTYTPVAGESSFSVSVQVEEYDASGNATGRSVIQQFDVRVGTLSTHPSFTSVPDVTTTLIKPSIPWSYDFEVSNLPTEAITYEIFGLSGATIDDLNTVLNWTPPANSENQTFEAMIYIKDARGIVLASQRFNVPVYDASTTGHLKFTQLPDRYAESNFLYSQQVGASALVEGNPDPNAVLVYSLESAPSGMTIDSTTGLISWRPYSIGNYDYKIIVENTTTSETVETTMFISVIAPPEPNEAPFSFTQTIAPAIKDVEYKLIPIVYDPNGDDLTYRLDADQMADYGLTIDENTGEITWTFTSADFAPEINSATIRVFVSDDAFETEISFTIPLLHNASPEFTPDEVSDTASIGTEYTYTISADDPNPEDLGSLNYEVIEAPRGFDISQNFSSETNQIIWTPELDLASGIDDTGLQRFTFKVTDNDGATDTMTLTLRVEDPAGTNAPVIVSAPRTEITTQFPYAHLLQGYDADGNAFIFELISSPITGLEISENGLLTWTPMLAQVSSTPYDVEVKISEVDNPSSFTTQTFQIKVVNTVQNEAPKINDVEFAEATAGIKFTQTLTATDAENDSLFWVLESGPDGLTINGKTGEIEWIPVLNSQGISQLGKQNFIVTVYDAFGAFDRREFTVDVNTDNKPPLAINTPPVLAANNVFYTYSYAGSDPENRGVFFSLLDAPTGMTINARTGVITWDIQQQNIPVGDYTFSVEVHDQRGKSVKNAAPYNVKVYDPSINKPPVIISTPDPIALIGDEYRYDVELDMSSVDDESFYTILVMNHDKNINNGADLGLKIDSNGVITSKFNNGKFIASQAGTYDISVKVSDNVFTVTQHYQLVIRANTAPTIEAIADQSVTEGNTFTQQVAATDKDGDSLVYEIAAYEAADPGTSVAGLFSIDANGLIIFESDDTMVGNVYTVTVKVHDQVNGLNQLMATQTFTLTIDEDTTKPEVNVAELPDQLIYGSDVTIDFFAADNVAIDSLSLTYTDTNGTPVTLNTFTDLNFYQDHGSVTVNVGSVVGSFTFSITATDVNGNSTTTPQQSVDVVSDIWVPEISISSPTLNGEITVPTDIKGTIKDDDLDSYRVELISSETGKVLLLKADDSVNDANINNGVLAHIDTTLLANGFYDIVITATDNNNEARVTRRIEVSGNFKLGNFTTGTTDLTVNAGNIPISVARTYDTLNADHAGDFGYGWSMDFGIPTIQVIYPDTSFSTIGEGTFVPFRSGTRIIVTLPDGTTEGYTFKPQLIINNGLGAPWGERTYKAYFAPDAGVTGQIWLENYDNIVLYKLGDEFLLNGTVFNPARGFSKQNFEYITPDRIHYGLDPTDSTKAWIEDPHGNRTTYTKNGITSTYGRNVIFERDASTGFITAIIDPAGNRLQYEYDAEGNLVNVYDRNFDHDLYDGIDTAGVHDEYDDADTKDNFTLQYTYHETFDHHLTTITNAAGRDIQTVGYGEDVPRVLWSEDELGNRTEYDFNSTTRIQRITDVLDNVRVLELDDNGNVIREDDALGNIILREYNGDNRLEKETIVVGLIDGENGNDETDDLVRSWTYNSWGQVLTETDELGNTTSYRYNQYGQLTATIDPGGLQERNYYDAENGNLTRSRNKLGNETTYTYYANGLPESITTSQGTVHFTFDVHGNLVSKTNPDGNITHYENNSLGQQTSVIREWRNLDDPSATPGSYETSMTYDDAGQAAQLENENGYKSKKFYNSDGEDIINLTQSHNDSGNLSWLLSLKVTVYDSTGYQTISTAVFEDPGNTDLFDENPTETSITYMDLVATVNYYNNQGQAIKTETHSNLQVKVSLQDGNYSTSLADGFELGIADSIDSETSYDDYGRISATANASNLDTLYIYNGQGQVVQARNQAINENGDIVWIRSRNIYDEYGRVQYQTNRYLESGSDAVYGTFTEYDSLGRIIRTTQYRDMVLSLNETTKETSLESVGTPVSSERSVYNSLGQLVRSLSLTFNEAGDDVQSTQETRYEYDNQGRTTAVLSPIRKTESGNLVRERTETSYNAQGQVSETRSNIWVNDEDYSVDDLNQVVKTFVYDQYGNRVETTITQAGSTLTTSTTYDVFGKVLSTADATGATRDYEYDAQGRQIAVVESVVHLDGDLVRHRMETVYDTLGQVVQTRSNIKVTVDENGDILDVDDQQAQVTDFEYDAFGNRTKTTVYEGLTEISTSTTYDVDGRIISETDALNQIKSYEYDDQGRLIKVTLPQVVDPENGIAPTHPTYEYAYDAFGNQISITDPLGRITTFTYDERGNQLSRTLPDGLEETFSYDYLNRIFSHVSFEGVKTEYLYDDSLNGTGQLIEKQFFTEENVSDIPDESFYYEYDEWGREISVTQTNGVETRVTTQTYNGKGELIQIDSPEGTVSYEYDAYGRKTRTFTGDPADPITDTLYTYDELGRLLTVSVVERNNVTLGTPETTRYEYDLVGNLDGSTLPNGVITDYIYDELNRLVSLIHYEGDATPETLSDNQKIVRFDYDLREDGRKNGSTETWYLDEFDTNSDGVVDENEAKEVTTSWTYDEANRLTDEVFTHYDDLLSQTSHFSYDLTGNRLSQEVTKDTDNDGSVDYEKVTTYSYDENDRLTQDVAEEDTNNDGVIDQTTTTDYTYDGTTQQTGKTVHEVGVTTSMTEFVYGYDLQGRMETVTKTYKDAGGVATRIEQTTYEYDATGIRVSAQHEVDTDADGEIDESAKTEYLNDPHNFTGYSQVIQETEFDENGMITKRTLYTIGHDQISQTTTEYMDSVQQAPQTLFFLADGHSSTRVLVDVVGAIANINGKEQVFFYDAYGNLLDQDNFQANQIGTSFLYSGEQFDTKIGGQQYLRARYYDATTGRFNRLDDFDGNSRDPQSFHKYLYTHADPVNSVDPSGEFIAAIGGFLGGGIGRIGNQIQVFATKAYITGSIYSNLAVSALRQSIITGKTAAFASASKYFSQLGISGATLTYWFRLSGYKFETWYPRFELATDLLDLTIFFLDAGGKIVSDYTGTFSDIPVERGREIEDLRGANLRGNVKGVDHFIRDDQGNISVISTRSHDVIDPKALRKAVLSDLTELFTKSHRYMTGYDGNGNYAKIDPDEVKLRVLDVFVPSQAANWPDSFKDDLEWEAKNNGYLIRITALPKWFGKRR